MLEEKRRQFWNRQRIPNKTIIFYFRISLLVFCYFKLNNKTVVFFPYNFYIATNRKRHVNRKRGRNSKIGNDTFVMNILTIPKLCLFLF